MTLIQMKCFSVVCEVLNFTKAAELLHVSQPAVSAAVKELEKECGVALFVRNKNSLQLTDEGQILLDSIQPILRQSDSLRQVVDGLQSGRKYIRLGFTTMFGNYVYSDVLTRFRRTHPEVQIKAVESSTEDLVEQLDNNRLDIILILPGKIRTEALRESERYRILPITRATLHFCVSRDHPLALKQEITWEDMANIPLVLTSDRFNISKNIEKRLREHGVEPNVIHYTDQIYTVERFIENNAAAGFLPAVVAARNRHIAGIPCDGLPSVGYLCAIWRRDRFRFQAEKDFLAQLEEYASKHMME